MTVDHVRQHEMRQAAEGLLRERYGEPGGRPVTGQAALEAVIMALNGYAPGGVPREVEAEDALAALTQVEEARTRLDVMEARLIAASRERGASWQRVAGALGLQSRQAAEGRALRLERATRRGHEQGRDVAAERIERARQRAVDTWCGEHADRLRDVAERLVDTSGAWGEAVTGNVLARSHVHLVATSLAAAAAPADLYDRLLSVRYDLAPYGRPRPEPEGAQAAAAARARADLEALCAEAADVRYAVTTARTGGGK